MIEVTENADKTFTISWDENDPQESVFNNWTEQDFINAIQNYLNTLQESGEVDINQVTEAVNQINDHIEEEFFIDQSAEEPTMSDYDWYTVKEEAIDEYLKETNIETYGDQGTEQSQGGTVSPPEHFPYFP